jgi:hypothetical protein
MQSKADEERFGTAVALLSLDRIVPYYSAMGLAPSQEHAEAIKECAREAISANRAAFLAGTTAVPDLAEYVRMAFERRFGRPAWAALLRWYENDFVHTAADLENEDWRSLLKLSRRDDARWASLGLPVRLSAIARDAFAKASDYEDIAQIEDTLLEQRRSGWDVQMYLIHGFDEDDDSGMCPFMWVRETVLKHRFQSYMRWLGAQLSVSERRALWSAGNALKPKISSMDKLPPLEYPFEEGQ